MEHSGRDAQSAGRVGQGPQLPDGTRQISASGPYYRGPGAPAAGPAHHYVFELYALDAPIDVAAVGQSPALTRAAVLAAMAGHVRGKGVYVGSLQALVWTEDDLQTLVLLLEERVVSIGRVVETQPMRDHETGIDFSMRDTFEQGAHVALHMRLS